MVKYINYIPILIMVASFIASFIYLVNGDIGKFVYWLSAGILTLAVTFLI